MILRKVGIVFLSFEASIRFYFKLTMYFCNIFLFSLYFLRRDVYSTSINFLFRFFSSQLTRFHSLCHMFKHMTSPSNMGLHLTLSGQQNAPLKGELSSIRNRGNCFHSTKDHLEVCTYLPYLLHIRLRLALIMCLLILTPSRNRRLVN